MMRVSRQKTDKLSSSGLVAKIAANIQKYPALAGGTAALSVAMMLITLNAVWYQSGQHPSPIYSTRINSDRFAGVRSQPDITGSTAIRRTAVSYSVQPLPTKKPMPASDELTKEIQMALAEKEIYSGVVDGIYGSRTQAAIIAYQQRKNLNASGKVSSKLLSHILLSHKVNSPTSTIADKIAAASQSGDIQPSSDKGLVSAIQSGLKNYGYDDIVIDGVMGDQTSHAIRGFELDYGLQITGRASKQILKKLTDIGAIDLG